MKNTLPYRFLSLHRLRWPGLVGLVLSSCGGEGPSGEPTSATPAVTSGGSQGGPAAAPADGASCTLSSGSDCDPECGAACGTASACLDICCTDTTTLGTTCGGTCVDVETNVEHCGECGNACEADEVCHEGACKVNCSPASPLVTQACEALCSKMGPDCAYGFGGPYMFFPFPQAASSGGTGGAGSFWESEAKCVAQCQGLAVEGPCAEASASLANCWTAALTCSQGAAVFAACDAEHVEAQSCVSACAPL